MNHVLWDLERKFKRQSTEKSTICRFSKAVQQCQQTLSAWGTDWLPQNQLLGLHLIWHSKGCRCAMRDGSTAGSSTRSTSATKQHANRAQEHSAKYSVFTPKGLPTFCSQNERAGSSLGMIPDFRPLTQKWLLANVLKSHSLLPEPHSPEDKWASTSSAGRMYSCNTEKLEDKLPVSATEFNWRYF